MPILIQCSGCQSKFKVKEQLAGKRVACSRCKTHIEIPATTSAAANSATGQQSTPHVTASNKSETPQSMRQKILQSLTKRFPPLIKHEEYRNAVMMVYAALIAAPIVLFFGLVVLVVLAAFTGTLICVIPFIFLMFLLTAIALIKPLFAPQPITRRPKALSREQEPFLYEFVQRISHVVNAPKPVSIEVDCDVNASARVEKHPMQNGEPALVVTLGLPLVVGLNVNQLAGVLAHEMGHFTQTEGFKSLSVARRIAYWFSRAVYERDGWDVWLDVNAQNDGFLFIIQLLSKFTKLCLKVLTIGIQLLTGYLLRRMEFDADRYEAHLVGAKVFESTCQRIGETGASFQYSISCLSQFLNDGQLGDDFPKLVAEHVNKLSKEDREEIRRHVESETTGIFDSHPSDFDRITRVKRENAKGVFHVDSNTSVLFTDLEKLCRDVTWDIYRGFFGIRVKRDELKSMDALIKEKNRQDQDAKDVEHRFQGVFHVHRPIQLESSFIDEQCDIPQRKQDLATARQRMHKNKKPFETAIKKFDMALEKQIETEQAVAVLNLARTAPDQRLAALASSRATALTDREQALKTIASLQAELKPAEDALKVRLSATLDLLMSGAVDHLDGIDKLKEEVDDLVQSVFTIRDSLEDAFKLQLRMVCQIAVLGEIEKYKINPDMVEQVLDNTDAMSHFFKEMRERLQLTRDPLNREEKRTIAEHLMARSAGLQYLGVLHNPFVFCEEMDGFLSRFYAFYYRVIGRLGSIMETIETGLGFEALEPKKVKPATNP